MENRCIICGAIIPEGREVCPNCEAGQKPEQKQEKEKDDCKRIATKYNVVYNISEGSRSALAQGEKSAVRLRMVK